MATSRRKRNGTGHRRRQTSLRSLLMQLFRALLRSIKRNNAAKQ